MEYKHLDKLREVLLDVPFVGLTATATEKYSSFALAVSEAYHCCNLL